MQGATLAYCALSFAGQSLSAQSSRLATQRQFLSGTGSDISQFRPR